MFELDREVPDVTVRFLERHGHMISHVTPERHLYISFTSSLFLSSPPLDSKEYRVFWLHGLPRSHLMFKVQHGNFQIT